MAMVMPTDCYVWLQIYCQETFTIILMIDSSNLISSLVI